MKRSCCLFTMVLILMLVSAGAAVAENRAGAYTLTPTIGVNLFGSDLDLKNDLFYGLDLMYNLNDRLGIELVYRHIDTENDNDVDVEGNYSHIDAIYHFLPENSVVPYVALGLGAFNLDPEGSGSETELSGNYGLGVKYFLTDNMALRTDIRQTLTFPETVFSFGTGLTYYYGGVVAKKKETPPEPVPAPEPAPVYEVKDSDGDGVPDESDKCPETPAGAKVDAQGCPLDSDKDGVIDLDDKCPGTPVGAVVDERGCWVVKDLRFDFNKSEIKPEYYKTLDDVIIVLKNNPAMRVEIQGHTDSKGTDDYNQKLSERRAKAVVDLLSRSGIEKSRLSYKGYGEAKPAATNDTEEGRAKNRRVEIDPIY